MDIQNYRKTPVDEPIGKNIASHTRKPAYQCFNINIRNRPRTSVSNLMIELSARGVVGRSLAQLPHTRLVVELEASLMRIPQFRHVSLVPANDSHIVRSALRHGLL